jgi:hypothetical protein
MTGPRKALSVLAVAAMALGACKAAAPESAVGQGGTNADTSSSFQGINTLVHFTDEALIGTVVSIGAPEAYDWPPDYPPEERGRWTTQDVTVTVEQVLFKNPDVPDTGVITLAASAESDTQTTPCGHAISAQDRSGGLAVGARVLLLTRYGDKGPGPHGPRPVWLGGWSLTWRIEGDRAVSVDPERTAPLQALVHRIQLERRLGSVPARNPGTEDRVLARAGSNKTAQQGCAEGDAPDDGQ